MENMSDVKNMFTQFIDTLTANMKPSVKTHFSKEFSNNNINIY